MLAWKPEPGASRFSTWEDDPVMTTALWWERKVRLAREAGSTLRLYHEIRYEALVTRPAAALEARGAELRARVTAELRAQRRPVPAAW